NIIYYFLSVYTRMRENNITIFHLNIHLNIARWLLYNSFLIKIDFYNCFFFFKCLYTIGNQIQVIRITKIVTLQMNHSLITREIFNSWTNGITIPPFPSFIYDMKIFKCE